MRSVKRLMDHTLTLTQPKKFKRYYEIKFGGETVATLSFPKTSSTTALVVNAEGTWSISREGAINKKIRATLKGESTDAAVVHMSGWRGETVIEFPTGIKYKVKTNIWVTLTEIQKEDGLPVLSIQSRGFFRNTTTITMNRTAGVSPNLPLLVILGIYIRLMTQRNSRG